MRGKRRSDLGVRESARGEVFGAIKGRGSAQWCVWALGHVGSAKLHMRARAFMSNIYGNGDLC